MSGIWKSCEGCGRETKATGGLCKNCGGVCPPFYGNCRGRKVRNNSDESVRKTEFVENIEREKDDGWFYSDEEGELGKKLF